MPRYTQVTPTFTPVDYATRIAPLEQYKDEYDKRLDKIEEQGLLADAIGGLIDENTDPELMQVYNDYSTKMQNTAKNLLDSGDLRSSRQSLLELRRDYANKLVPIQQAFNNRADAAKSFRDAKMKDPSLLGKDPVNTSLSSWMNGKAPDTKTISGNQLYAYGQANAKAASGREFRETAWRLDKNLGNQFFTRIKAEGWNQDEVIQALAGYVNSGDKNISKDAKALLDYMVQARDTIHNMTGVDELGDSNMIAAADRYIIDGFIDGISYKQEDKQQAYDPYKFETAKYNMEAAKWKAKKAQADYEKSKTEEKKDRPSISHERLYNGSGNRELINRATTQFQGITNRATGEIVSNPLDAYRALHANDKRRKELEERKREIENGREVYNSEGRKVVRDINKATKTTYSSRVINNELTNEYNSIIDELNGIELDDRQRNLLYKPVALSEKEYKELAGTIGMGEDFSVKDVADFAKNNIEYTNNPIPYNVHTIASKGQMQDLKKEIAVDIQGVINEFPDTKFIYKTNDGVRPSSNGPVKVKSDIFDNDNIESINIDAFGVANGYLRVVTKDDGMFLVPINKLRNEAGRDIVGKTNDKNVKRSEYFKSMIYGNGDDIQSRFRVLDEGVYDVADEIATVYGYDLRQMLGGKSAKGQYEFNTVEE